MDNQDTFKFTSKESGGHQLIVNYVWNLLAGVKIERWQEWGLLNDDLNWEFKFPEMIEENHGDEK